MYRFTSPPILYTRQMGIRRIIRIVAVVACVFTTAMLLYSTRTLDRKSSWWFGAALVLMWGFSPYLFLMILAKRSIESAKKLKVVCGGTIFAVATSIFLYIDGFFLIDDTSWSGLLFIVVPVCQWGEVVITTGVVAIVGRKANDKSEN